MVCVYPGASFKEGLMTFKGPPVFVSGINTVSSVPGKVSKQLYDKEQKEALQGIFPLEEPSYHLVDVAVYTYDE